MPSSIKEIYSDNKLSGLQAKTFIVYDKVTNSPKELVIAFAGTNQFRDWLTNAQVSDKQFKQALDYYNKSVQREEVGDPKKLNKIVVTGYSLGGALAVSVGKNKNVVEKISEVWVFNPSPKSHTDYKKESNFWFGSARNDILKKVRTSEYMNLFESDHIYDDQFLIDSNAVYAHSRWVVARNMLWTADFSYITGESEEYDNPAYEIIQLSEFKSCKNK